MQPVPYCPDPRVFAILSWDESPVTEGGDTRSHNEYKEGLYYWGIREAWAIYGATRT
jgi:hypothetical protein